MSEGSQPENVVSKTIVRTDSWADAQARPKRFRVFGFFSGACFKILSTDRLIGLLLAVGYLTENRRSAFETIYGVNVFVLVVKLISLIGGERSNFSGQPLMICRPCLVRQFGLMPTELADPRMSLCSNVSSGIARHCIGVNIGEDCMPKFVRI